MFVAVKRKQFSYPFMIKNIICEIGVNANNMYDYKVKNYNLYSLNLFSVPYSPQLLNL